MTNSTQKQIIVLKTDDSTYFEAAHLILRQEQTKDEGMISEACRIISLAEARGIYPRTRKSNRPPASRMTWFFLGIATALGTGGIGALLAYLLF